MNRKEKKNKTYKFFMIASLKTYIIVLPRFEHQIRQMVKLFAINSDQLKGIYRSICERWIFCFCFFFSFLASNLFRQYLRGREGGFENHRFTSSIYFKLNAHEFEERKKKLVSYIRAYHSSVYLLGTR